VADLTPAEDRPAPLDAPLTYQGDPGMREEVQELAESGWIVTWARRDGGYSEDLDGISWHAAAVPAWDHVCASQTRGVLPGFGVVRRCSCGAFWLTGARWADRNSRRLEQGERLARSWLGRLFRAYLGSKENDNAQE
jgi:hypothetical protein